MSSSLKCLFLENFKLCEIGNGQTVAVLSEGEELSDYREASLVAASELGATVLDACIPTKSSMQITERMADIGQNSLQEHPEVMDACLHADIVIDHMLLLFSREQTAMQKAGARVLLIVEPPEILERLFPTLKLCRRVKAAEKYLGNAKTLRFTNDVGTDVTYQLGNSPILTEYGFTSDAGRWDHWPGGFLATLAKEQGVNGRVVMNAGDIIFPLKSLLNAPVEFVIQNSLVVAINGGEDAAALKSFMASYEDPRAYAVSHIGWGLNPDAEWSVEHPGIGMDGRAFCGNVLFSLGPDTEFGGSNDTSCHLDLPMRYCTLTLDGKVMVENGEIVPNDMRNTSF